MKNAAFATSFYLKVFIQMESDKGLRSDNLHTFAECSLMMFQVIVELQQAWEALKNFWTFCLTQ